MVGIFASGVSHQYDIVDSVRAGDLYLDTRSNSDIISVTIFTNLVTGDQVMPKAFSEREKEIIRAQLHEKGRLLFERQGLKKTSVDELAQAAGISKGAFYLFYESKEELFMEILEELEADFRMRIFDFSISPKRNAHQLLARLFKDVLLTWDEYPLLKNFARSEYEYLARKLPAQRIQAHAHRDNEFVDEFLKRI